MFSSHPGPAIALRLSVHLYSLTWINNITSAANPVSSVNSLCHGGVNILFSASLYLCIIMTWQRVIYNLRGGSLTTCGSRSQNSSFSSIDMFVLLLSFFPNPCPVRSRGVSLNGRKHCNVSATASFSPKTNLKHQQCADVCHRVKSRHVSVLYVCVCICVCHFAYHLFHCLVYSIN